MTVTVKKTAGETPETMSVPSRTTSSPHPLVSLRDEIDRLFDSVFAAPLGWRMLERDPLRRLGFGTLPSFGDITPHMDVKETDTAIELTAELPGMVEKDVEVTLSDGILTVKGEKRVDSEEKGADYHLSERRYGAFHRTFRLPDTVEEDKITAAVDKGVLTVTLPKTARPDKETRRIEVKGK